MATFQVDVVSPEALLWSGEAEFLVARTPDGEIGVMAGHEPVMGALVTGAIKVEAPGGEITTIAAHGGFIQVLDNQVTLLTDRAEVVEGGADEAREQAAVLAQETTET